MLTICRNGHYGVCSAKMIAAKRVGVVLGVLAIGWAVLLATSKINAAGADCGTVMAPESYGASTFSEAFIGQICESDIGNRRTSVIGFAVVGVLGVLFGVAWPNPKPADPNAARAVSDQEWMDAGGTG